MRVLVPVPRQTRTAGPSDAQHHLALHLQAIAGNRAVARLHAAANDASQAGSGPALRVTAPGDACEVQAHRQADAASEQIEGILGKAGRTGSATRSRPKSRVQRSVGGGATTGEPVSPALNRAVAAAQGGGRPLDREVRAGMEEAFGTRFANVRVHADSRADTLARSLSAKAFTVGSDVFFGRGRYDARSAGGRQLLAHELAHVVQRRYDGRSRLIRRAITTNGGTWSANKYNVVPDGAEILLEFKPNNNVDATKIGLIQRSKKVERGMNYDISARADYEAGKWQPEGAKRKAQRSEGKSHIDRVIQANNPVYGAPNLAQNETIGKTPMGGINIGPKAEKKNKFQNFQLGYRKKKGKFLGFIGGGWETRSAKLYDKPNLPGATSALQADDTKTSEMKFETTALCLSGNQKDAYYGSVEWGFRIDDANTGPVVIPLRKLSDGDPTARMQRVMQNWNAGEFDTGVPNPQIPVPGGG